MLLQFSIDIEIESSIYYYTYVFAMKMLLKREENKYFLLNSVYERTNESEQKKNCEKLTNYMVLRCSYRNDNSN